MGIPLHPGNRLGQEAAVDNDGGFIGHDDFGLSGEWVDCFARGMGHGAWCITVRVSELMLVYYGAMPLAPSISSPHFTVLLYTLFFPQNPLIHRNCLLRNRLPGVNLLGPAAAPVSQFLAQIRPVQQSSNFFA